MTGNLVSTQYLLMEWRPGVLRSAQEWVLSETMPEMRRIIQPLKHEDEMFHSRGKGHLTAHYYHQTYVRQTY